MRTLTHHAARATFRQVRSTIEVCYSGPITSDALLNLRMGLLANMADSTHMILRYEKSMLLMGRMPVHARQAYRYQSAAIVVRDDQRPLFNVYVAELALIGVEREIFLEAQLELAREWSARRVDRRSRLTGQRPVMPVVELSHSSQ